MYLLSFVFVVLGSFHCLAQLQIACIYIMDSIQESMYNHEMCVYVSYIQV